jgi:hypothetical protein
MPPAKDANQFVNGSRSTLCNKLDTVKKQMRILSYEKTIVGHALTQIDHAQTAGQIGEHSHNQLLTKYSNRMTQLEQQLSNNQQIIQLDELTATRNSLTQLFNEKMGHISSEIAEIQSFLNPIPFESRRQARARIQSQATSLSTRHWGSMKNVFVFFAIIMLLISSSSYAFGFLFNQQYFTQDFAQPQESAQNISDQRITSSTGITASVNLGVYFDNITTREVTSIDWGIVYPDDQAQQIIYLQNVGNVNCQLLLNTTDWAPQEAQHLITVTWNYNGTLIEPNTIIQVTISLNTSAQLVDIEQFDFNLIITSIALE